MRLGANCGSQPVLRITGSVSLGALLIPSLPKLVFWLVGFKSGCPDSKTEGRYPDTLRMMTCLGAIRPLAAREGACFYYLYHLHV